MGRLQRVARARARAACPSRETVPRARRRAARDVHGDLEDPLKSSIDELATRANLDEPTRDALRSFASSVNEGDLARDGEAVRAGRIEDRPPLWNLLIALGQIDEGDERHARLGIERDVSDATWRDIGLWATTFRKRMGFVGITTEILGWAQSYLRGGVIRVGAVQWEFQTSSYARAFAFRQRETNDVAYAIAPGTWLSYGGRHRCNESDSGARCAHGEIGEGFVRAHVIDTRRASVHFASLVTFDARNWETLLEPGSAMMEMHIPADAPLDMTAFVQSQRRAESIFARIHSRKAAGCFGDAWLLDPQVREMMPDNFGIAAFQSAVSLLPGGIPEAKTIRRFFGANATRASIATQASEGMTSLQRAIVRFLGTPENMLCAACGVLLRRDVEALERALQ
jgi:hypothetical protein